MTKSEAMERPEKAGKMTALRLDTKTRYLADLAAAVSKESLTKYIEAALWESFKKITLRLQPEQEIVYDQNGNPALGEPLDPEQERIQNEAMTIANQADLLWNESEYVRMLMLSIIADHLLSDEDKALLKYVHDRKDLRRSGAEHKPNREKINAEWDSIKADFAKLKKRKAE